MADTAPWEEKTWATLAELDPADVCRRSLVSTEGPGLFTVPFLTTPYHVSCPDQTVQGPAGEAPGELQLVLLNYLIGASTMEPTGNWVNERSLAGGELFFAGPHALPVSGLCARFGRDADGFLRAGAAYGGERMEYGDVSLRLQALPRIPLVCILWTEDEEFPARVSYLLDPTADKHLRLDAILGLVKRVGQVLIETADAAS